MKGGSGLGLCDDHSGPGPIRIPNRRTVTALSSSALEISRVFCRGKGCSGFRVSGFETARESSSAQTDRYRQNPIGSLGDSNSRIEKSAEATNKMSKSAQSRLPWPNAPPFKQDPGIGPGIGPAQGRHPNAQCRHSSSTRRHSIKAPNACNERSSNKVYLSA